VGMALLIPLNPHWSFANMAVRFAVGGLGMGLFLPPSSVAVMAATPHDHVGVGGALTNTARYLGFALGPTVATLLWDPSSHGAVGTTAMRTVLIVLSIVQLVTIATVAGYRVLQNTGSTGIDEVRGGHSYMSGAEAL